MPQSPREDDHRVSSVELLHGYLSAPHRRVGGRIKSHVEAICAGNFSLDVLSDPLRESVHGCSGTAGGGGDCMYTSVLCFLAYFKPRYPTDESTKGKLSAQRGVRSFASTLHVLLLSFLAIQDFASG